MKKAIVTFLVGLLACIGCRARQTVAALGPDVTLDDWFDSRTGTYYEPIVSPPPGSERLAAEIIRNDPRFSPSSHHLRQAILDTGVMHKHPLLRKVKIVDKDFTGEGPEDLNGHGTMVALITVKMALPVMDEIINVKVLNRRGLADVGTIKAALDWLYGLGDIVVVNMSLGVPKALDSSLCTYPAAMRDRLIVFAAVGNDPRVPMCPAAGTATATNIIAVGAIGYAAPTPPTVVVPPFYRNMRVPSNER